jgi:hypothetical protein
MASSLEKQLKFVRVDGLSGPGEYRFATPITRPDSFGGPAPLLEVYSPQPRLKDNDIPNQLKERFSDTIKQRFLPAIQSDDTYMPARFESEHLWDSLDLEGNYLKLNGETVFILAGRSYSKAGGEWYFKIKDVGALSIANNELLIDKAAKRDGSIHLSIHGMPADGSIPDYWKAWVDYKGENPGMMVKAVAEYINEEKERLAAPLWKKSDLN